jgi:23S rRNA pseudouridine2605 synthase
VTSPPPPGERIAKLLSRAGIASRREAERLIELGQVAVNGKVVASPALNVTPADRITVAGRLVEPPGPVRLWLYHKPPGLVTSAADEKGRETVFDRLPPDLPRVMTIGRLDLTSEGLLLLTNDGALKRRLELPATGWLRKYRVRVKGTPDDALLAPLRAGITVEGERFQPMTVTLDRQQGANAWLTIGLREGRNREIRRALATLGLTVNRLIRTGYGPFKLGDLAAGAVAEVRGRILQDQLGLDAGAVAPPPGRRPAKPGVAAPAAPPAGTAAPARAGDKAGAKVGDKAGKQARGRTADPTQVRPASAHRAPRDAAPAVGKPRPGPGTRPRTPRKP